MNRSLRSILQIFSAILAAQTLSGCYFNANVTGRDSKGGPNIERKAGGGEFGSGSTEYVETQLRRYKVMASAGGYYRNLVGKTARGYKIYSSIQGVIISGSQQGVQ